METLLATIEWRGDFGGGPLDMLAATSGFGIAIPSPLLWEGATGEWLADPGGELRRDRLSRSFGGRGEMGMLKIIASSGSSSSES